MSAVDNNNTYKPEYLLNETYNSKQEQVQDQVHVLDYYARNVLYTEFFSQNKNVTIRHLNNEKSFVDRNDILSVLSGTIMEIQENKVLIKFENGSRVNFPKQLFLDESLLRFGTAVRYFIKIDNDGCRYQSFELDEQCDDYDTTEIDSILASF